MSSTKIAIIALCLSAIIVALIGLVFGWIIWPTFLTQSAPKQLSCVGPTSEYSFIGNRITPGSTIGTCQGLKSANDAYMLVQQSDGNLVMYNTKTNKPIWAHNIQNGIPLAQYSAKLPNHTIYQSDYNFATYNAGGDLIWEAGLANKTSTDLVMQEDGNLVIYNTPGLKPTNGVWKGNAIWASRTVGK